MLGQLRQEIEDVNIARKRKWTHHENNVLRKTIRRQGKNMEALVRALEGTRTRKQIRDKVAYLKRKLELYPYIKRSTLVESLHARWQPSRHRLGRH